MPVPVELIPNTPSHGVANDRKKLSDVNIVLIGDTGHLSAARLTRVNPTFRKESSYY